MYNDTIKVANKIITFNDLSEIFAQMNEKLMHYKKVSEIEEKKNHMLDYKYQNWTFKDYGSKLKFEIDFYDDTQINFDNYNNFISVFNNRIDEIKSIYVNFTLSYNVELQNQKKDYYTQHINMWIYENKMDIDISLSSEDKKIYDIYELIKKKILNAPRKYDLVIKKKKKITTIVGLAIGFIPSLILTTSLIAIPTFRQICAQGYVLYPILTLLLSLFLGTIIGSSLLESYYEKITPEKKYAGYNEKSGSSIYKDDIEQYTKTSEILIGKNVNNLKYRKKIKKYYKKYKKWIPYELGVMILISILVLFIGNI